MVFAIYPFKYYYVLPDYTLANKIREKSWELDRLFPLLKKRKKELKKLLKSIKSSHQDILKVRQAIYALALEIKLGIKDLKFINFYDSALLYLYYRLLRHVSELCKSEEKKLRQEMQKDVSKEKSLKHAENIKNESKNIERKIKENGESVKSFESAKKRLVEAYEKLVDELRKRKWDTEKQAQHEFTLLLFTLRGMENLNRKIKVEAIKTKNRIAPRKAALMLRIRKKPSPQDVIELAKLVSKAIDRISKDVYYSSKLISKFEKEMKIVKEIVENLKKKINKLTKQDKKREAIKKELFDQWGNVIKNTEGEINKDLMQIFRNVFVEYKYVGTRNLE